MRDAESPKFDPYAIQRPDAALQTYYVIVSAMTLIGFPFVFLPLWIRYVTLRYRIDDEGVSMSWGFLFRKEVLLTYRRVQDIHVRRNLIHRWLGLAEVAIQTASGASGAQMTIEGIRNPEALRDFLYEKMRGAKGEQAAPKHEGSSEGTQEQGQPADEALALLREIRDHLKTSGGRVS